MYNFLQKRSFLEKSPIKTSRIDHRTAGKQSWQLQDGGSSADPSRFLSQSQVMERQQQIQSRMNRSLQSSPQSTKKKDNNLYHQLMGRSLQKVSDGRKFKKYQRQYQDSSNSNDQKYRFQKYHKETKKDTDYEQNLLQLKRSLEKMPMRRKIENKSLQRSFARGQKDERKESPRNIHLKDIKKEIFQIKSPIENRKSSNLDQRPENANIINYTFSTAKKNGTRDFIVHNMNPSHNLYQSSKSSRLPESKRHKIDLNEQSLITVSADHSTFVNSLQNSRIQNSLFTSFEGSRKEMKIFLDQIGGKMNEELDSIHSTICLLQKDWILNVKTDLLKVQQTLSTKVKEIVERSSNIFEEYLKSLSSRVLRCDSIERELYQRKSDFENWVQKIDALREELNCDSWKKVSAVIIQENIEQRIGRTLEENQNRRAEIENALNYRTVFASLNFKSSPKGSLELNSRDKPIRKRNVQAKSPRTSASNFDVHKNKMRKILSRIEEQNEQKDSNFNNQNQGSRHIFKSLEESMTNFVKYSLLFVE